MPTRYACFALLCVALLGSAGATSLQIGQPAPGFALPRADGTMLDADTLRGKVVIVDFWASWCGPCRQSFPFLDQLQQRYADQGLAVVGVNVDAERSEAERFLTAVPVSFAIVFDPAGKTPEAYSVKAMPSSFLIGRDGRVRALHLGFRKRDGEELEAQVKAALADGAP